MSYEPVKGDMVRIIAVPPKGEHGYGKFSVGEICEAYMNHDGKNTAIYQANKADWWYLDDYMIERVVPVEPLKLTDINRHDILQYKDDFLFVNEVYLPLDCVSVTSLLGKHFIDVSTDLREEHIKDITQVVCNLTNIFSSL